MWPTRSASRTATRRASCPHWGSLAHYITGALQRVLAGFAGADADGVGQRRDEDLAVADLAGLGRAHDGVDHPLGVIVIDHDLDLDLGHEVDGVLRAAVHLGVPLLPAEAADLGDGHALDALLAEGVLHVFQLEVADDRFNLLHRRASRGGRRDRWPR